MNEKEQLLEKLCQEKIKNEKKMRSIERRTVTYEECVRMYHINRKSINKGFRNCTFRNFFPLLCLISLGIICILKPIWMVSFTEWTQSLLPFPFDFNFEVILIAVVTCSYVSIRKEITTFKNWQDDKILNENIFNDNVEDSKRLESLYKKLLADNKALSQEISKIEENLTISNNNKTIEDNLSFLQTEKERYKSQSNILDCNEKKMLKK